MENKHKVTFEWQLAFVQVFVNGEKVGHVRWMQKQEHYGFFAVANMQSYLMLIPRDFRAVMAACVEPALESYASMFPPVAKTVSQD